MAQTLARAWPIYVTGAAAASLMALAELVLPALLEQRAIVVSWAGPLLAGFSVAAALGAALYSARGTWPGSLRTQSLVLLLGVTACVTLAATAPSLAWISGALVLAGFLESGVQLTRNLSLRAALPPSTQPQGTRSCMPRPASATPPAPSWPERCRMQPRRRPPSSQGPG